MKSQFQTAGILTELFQSSKIKEEARDDLIKQVEFLSAHNKKLQIDNMSLAEDLFATKKDHENQLKIKEDIMKTMNKSFT